MVKTMFEIEQDLVGYGSKSVTKLFSNGARIDIWRVLDVLWSPNGFDLTIY